MGKDKNLGMSTLTTFAGAGVFLVICLFILSNHFGIEQSTLANFGSYFGGILTGAGVLIAGLGYYEGKIERKHKALMEESDKAMRLISLMPREDMYGALDPIALNKDYKCIKSHIQKIENEHLFYIELQDALSNKIDSALSNSFICRDILKYENYGIIDQEEIIQKARDYLSLYTELNTSP